jgi:hypothetical protein
MYVIDKSGDIHNAETGDILSMGSFVIKWAIYSGTIARAAGKPQKVIVEAEVPIRCAVEKSEPISDKRATRTQFRQSEWTALGFDGSFSGFLGNSICFPAQKCTWKAVGVLSCFAVSLCSILRGELVAGKLPTRGSCSWGAWATQARSAGGSRGEKVDRDASHWTHQLMIVIQT